MLLRRQRLEIDCHARGRDEAGVRIVSPQRLIHYRDNGYLDAWCHLRQALRSFSVDAIERVEVLDKTAIEVPDKELEGILGSGYGIFAGKDIEWAVLLFSAERARWVADETWHPRQSGRTLADGRYRLSVPHADPRELVKDILRHVPEVEVAEPPVLRALVHERIRQTAQALD